MDHSTHLDGSEASHTRPSPPPLYTNFKLQLFSALTTFDCLDKASLAMLKHDTEYHKILQRLLAPHTATPLSEFVEEMMKSGLEAISSKMSALISAEPQSSQLAGSLALPTPTSISQISESVNPAGDAPSAPSTMLTAEGATTDSSTTQETRAQQVETLVKGVQIRSLETIQQVIDESQNRLYLVWIYLQGGNWIESGLDVSQLVDEMNQKAVLLHGKPIWIDGWMSQSRTSIVLFTHSTTKWGVISRMIRRFTSKLTLGTGCQLVFRPDDRTYPHPFTFL